MVDFKFFTAFILFVMTALPGLCLLYCRHFEKERWYQVAYIDLLGRGLLFGAAIFHFLPEGIGKLAQSWHLDLIQIYLSVAALGIVFLVIFNNFNLMRRIIHFFSNENLQRYPSYFLPFVILAVLSIHALSEGIIFGATLASLSLAGMGAGILLHKTSEAVILTSMTYQQRMSVQQQVAMVLFFSIMTPIGVMFGASVTAYFFRVHAIAESIFNILASMLFIYIALSCHRWCQLPKQFNLKTALTNSTFGIGFLLMGLLTYLHV